MAQTAGKRTAQRAAKPHGGRIALIVVLAAAVVLAAGYLGLCAAAGSGVFLPNTAIAGVDVSGQTQEQAAETLKAQLPDRLAQLSVPFTCAEQDWTISGGEASVTAESVEAAVREAMDRQSGGFLTRGAQYLGAMTSGAQYSVPVTFENTPSVVEQVLQEYADPDTQTTWEVRDDQLVLRKGVTGRTIDVTALVEAAEARLSQLLTDGSTDNSPLETNVATAPPAEPDFDAIREQVCVEAADAYLDKESKEIVPSVTGVSLDTAAAKSALDGAEEGSEVSVPLTYTEPEITTAKLQANLFKDVLGTGTTSCAGPSARWYNIDLAADRVNGTILLPGEVFSYNALAGPYTKASGYKDAGTYQNGQSIDATAGGICQLSSTIYWVTLKANLETVERSKHAFNGGYMPVVGTDATVWSDQIDFKFKNSTDYPIKIETYQDKNHKLHVTIYGTDTTGIHGEPYSVTISTTPYKNLYKPDASIPQGTEPQRDPNYSRYNGITVDVYQKLVDKNGNTVDTIFLYRNSYKSSDAVYYYNPADAARWGIDPSTGLKTLTPVEPTPTPSTAPSTAPSTTPSTTPSATPSATPSTTPSATPSATPSTAPSAAPTTGPGMEPTDSASPAPEAESPAA